jgi:hypothetical protein
MPPLSAQLKCGAQQQRACSDARGLTSDAGVYTGTNKTAPTRQTSIQCESTQTHKACLHIQRMRPYTTPCSTNTRKTCSFFGIDLACGATQPPRVPHAVRRRPRRPVSPAATTTITAAAASLIAAAAGVRRRGRGHRVFGRAPRQRRRRRRCRRAASKQRPLAAQPECRVSHVGDSAARCGSAAAAAAAEESVDRRGVESGEPLPEVHQSGVWVMSH